MLTGGDPDLTLTQTLAVMPLNSCRSNPVSCPAVAGVGFVQERHPQCGDRRRHLHGDLGPGHARCHAVRCELVRHLAHAVDPHVCVMTIIAAASLVCKAARTFSAGTCPILSAACVAYQHFSPVAGPKPYFTTHVRIHPRHLPRANPRGLNLPLHFRRTRHDMFCPGATLCSA